jgi:enamine deaminase RidA (YjgF/YER057c/UK114 family)
MKAISSHTAPRSIGGYAQALLTTDARQFLFISGQIPESLDGQVPDDFASQCRLVWRNVVAQLEAAQMTVKHLAKVTIFLSSREHAEANSAFRREVLKGHEPALTVIITGIFDERWLLEIEGIAAA